MTSEQQELLQALVKTYRPIEELIPAHWREGDVFANGIRHHYYRTGGEKPPLLLLHGFNEYGLTWLRIAGELEGDYALFDLELARESMKLWTSTDKDNPAELLKRVTCPALIMKHAWSFPAPGTQPVVREVDSEQRPGCHPERSEGSLLKIVYFENTGHLIRRVAFEPYLTIVRAFLRGYSFHH